jgi:hypothetical protein
MPYDGLDFQGELGAELSTSPPLLHGDFYCGSADVSRGLTLPPLDEVASLGIRFHATDIAPVLSEDVKSYLEATTVILDDCLPMDAGNKLLTFFEDQDEARVSKVSRKKFTIRAAAIVQGFDCDVKIRIYQHDFSCALEFQKRDGDSVAFIKLFGLAAKHLQLSDGRFAVMDRDTPGEVEQTIAVSPAQRLAPLLDMARSCENQKLLAEVSSVLAVAAKDPQVAAELRMPCAFSVLQQLERADDFRVALPASRALMII